MGMVGVTVIVGILVTVVLALIAMLLPIGPTFTKTISPAYKRDVYEK